jgi:5'-nucleotidase
MGEAITVLPFQNTLSTFQIKGGDIVAALENGVSQIEEGGGRFPQVAGLKFAFDRSKPVGSRISNVEVKEGEAFVALDPAKAYNVVSNNYMRNGGDGYSIFKTKAENAYDYGPGLETVLADYLAAHNPYKPMTDGRITEIAAATETQPSAQASTDTAAQTATPEAKPAAEAAGAETRHVIAKGDTLWGLAKAIYGNGELWKTIAAANGNPVPEKLEIGKELQIPAK